MKKLSFLILLLTINSCDDGDFDVPSFDFDGITINNCGNLVFHKISSSKTEALILNLSVDNEENAYFTTELTDKTYSITETGSNTLTYRIFNGEVSSSYFCQDIPSVSPTVSKEWLGNGTLVVNNTITLDDEDGVLAAIENDLSAYVDLFDATVDLNDIDGDGYPNYIDTDDDGDNITTLKEDLDGDGDPTNDDTDNDGIPNYLDADDDGDGVPSINESKTADGDGDILLVDYLDADTTTVLEPVTTPVNNYKQSYVLDFIFSSLNLRNDESEINYADGFTYGSKTGTFTISDLPEAE
ncbi:hypothetical protein [Flavicella sediminum]|uniref:hypothetical protein n=1 Tax=Flavicella sediminum TaxID=2585141 RepID=UPI001AA0924D|nr:hypothetical protein [Flavicella sediminum]